MFVWIGVGLSVLRDRPMARGVSTDSSELVQRPQGREGCPEP